MKYLNISESVMWALLVIGAIFGGAVIGWQTIIDWQALPSREQSPVLSSATVDKIAEDFLETHFALPLDSFQKSQILMSQPLPETFLKKSYLAEDEVTKYKDTYLGASTLYYVRFFKPEMIEEYEVSIDAFRGTVVDFHRTLPEDTPIESVTEEEAIIHAQQFVAQKIGEQPEVLRVHEKEEEKYPGGVERIITLSRFASEVDSQYGKGFVTYTLGIQGGHVNSFYPAFEYPEPYERMLEQSSNVGMLVGFLSLLAWIIMLIAALVYMIKSFSAHTAVWKFTIVIVAVLGVLSIIDFVNQYPELLAGYDTIDTISTYWIFVGAFTIFGVIISSLMFLIPSVAGHTLALGEYRDRISPLLHLPSTADTKLAYRFALIRGYLLGVSFLGFTYALYYIGDTYLGVWYPMGDSAGSIGMSAFVPAFSLMLSLGIMAAITEEVTFRLFGILWISKVCKSTFVGVLVATVVWAFAHTDGSVLPVWFRGVEVLIGGLLFAYFFMRYNILTTIVAHYVHNVILGATLLLFTFGYEQLIPSVLIVLMPLLTYLVFELVVSYMYKHRELEK